MNAPTATDEITDLIASIEMHRQELKREAGLEPSRNYALRRLHEALGREQAACELAGPNAGLGANIDALTQEIKRVQALGGSPQRPTLKPSWPRQAGNSRRGPQRHSSGTRGRKARPARGTH